MDYFLAMIMKINETGLYWHPLGGNNIDQISGHCYHYLNISKTKQKTSIIIDIGKYDNHQAFGVEDSQAAIPDIRFLLENNQNRAKALLLTHSHPDHMNGIVHYIKAGYTLPAIYGGRYTYMILKQLLDFFDIEESERPEFITIDDGDVIKIGDLEIETIASSHTCFDSFGFIIRNGEITLYHSGDMKIDDSTYLRKPTNIKRLKELANEISVVMADFCQIYKGGFTPKESDTFNKMVSSIKKCAKKKIFIPVYPTHPEMYIIAFLAALETRKNVIFYGSKDFYSYLDLIIDYDVSFEKLAEDKIKILYKAPEKIADYDDSYAIIGTYNDLDPIFEATSLDSYAIITSRNFFNPLKEKLRERNINLIDVSTATELQGYGHGFLEDYRYINDILNKPIFIPSHCPAFVIDNFRKLSKVVKMKIIDETPKNNTIYKIDEKKCYSVCSSEAKWLVVRYEGNKASFIEAPQIPTAGKGNIRSTISNRRSLIHIRANLEILKKGKKI